MRMSQGVGVHWILFDHSNEKEFYKGKIKRKKKYFELKCINTEPTRARDDFVLV